MLLFCWKTNTSYVVVSFFYGWDDAHWICLCSLSVLFPSIFMCCILCYRNYSWRSVLFFFLLNKMSPADWTVFLKLVRLSCNWIILPACIDLTEFVIWNLSMNIDVLEFVIQHGLHYFGKSTIYISFFFFFFFSCPISVSCFVMAEKMSSIRWLNKPPILKI